MENLKAGRKKNRIESRMTKSLSHYEKAAIYKICRVEQGMVGEDLGGREAIDRLNMGSAYEGYVVWNSGKATKYYAFDVDTTYRAVMRASDQLKLEATVIKSAPKEGYSLSTKGDVPMHIDILPLEKSVTTVVISIPTFGDKDYVELFYKLVDDNLPPKAAVDKEKIQ